MVAAESDHAGSPHDGFFAGSLLKQLEERKATTLGKPIERRIFPDGKDERGEPYTNLRWSRFKNFAGPEMFRM